MRLTCLLGRPIGRTVWLRFELQFFLASWADDLTLEHQMLLLEDADKNSCHLPGRLLWRLNEMLRAPGWHLSLRQTLKKAISCYLKKRNQTEMAPATLFHWVWTNIGLVSTERKGVHGWERGGERFSELGWVYHAAEDTDAAQAAMGECCEWHLSSSLGLSAEVMTRMTGFHVSPNFPAYVVNLGLFSVHCAWWRNQEFIKVLEICVKILHPKMYYRDLQGSEPFVRKHK